MTGGLRVLCLMFGVLLAAVTVDVAGDEAQQADRATGWTGRAIVTPSGSAEVEQQAVGTRPEATLVESSARRITLRQQGTFAPDGFFRWMASPAIDRFGNIGIGYSFGRAPHFAGQRFAARLAADSLGQLTLAETVLAEGEGAQNAMRWEDYAQTATDPVDDCTIWYVGDYLKKDAASYSSRIGAFRLPGCR